MAEGAGSEEPLERREAGLWLRVLLLRSPPPGGSRSLAAGHCSPSRVTAGPAGGPVRPRGKQVGGQAGCTPVAACVSEENKIQWVYKCGLRKVWRYQVQVCP